MLLRRCRFKQFIIVTFMVAALLITQAQDSIAESVSIRGVMKIHRMGGYVILINFETQDKWADNLIFKVHCRFERGEFTFASSTLSNVERGWHKTQIAISDVLKKRYGSLREYKVDLYKSGILVDTKKSY